MKKMFIILLVLTLGGLNAKTIRSHRELKYDGIKDIEISSSIGDVEIVTEDRDSIDILLESPNKSVKLNTKVGNRVLIEVKRPFFSFFVFRRDKIKLTVIVPKSIKGSMEVDLSSGDLDISDFKLGNISISMSSGDLTSRDIVAKNISLTSSSGDIYITNSISEGMNTKLSSGNLDIDGLKTSKSKIHNSSGRLNIANSNITSLKISSSSGNTTLSNFQGEIIGESSSGNVSIDLKDITGDIFYKVSSGNIGVNVSADTINSRIKLNTSSGNIDFNFPITIRGVKSKKSVDGVSGNGQFNIDLTTSSGNISVLN